MTSPWPIKIFGLIEKPMTFDARGLAELFSLEDCVYRFRCVEAWASVVPRTGFPLSKLIEGLSPKSDAKFVRFETFNRSEQTRGMKSRGYPRPCLEGLRMDAAMHPLTMVVTGVNGKPLPNQHGAPVWLVVPWKYRYKSIKSIVRIEFVREQQILFWEILTSDEYPFASNVGPKIPHPRWSHSFERMIDTGDRMRPQPYNGYATLSRSFTRRVDGA